MAPGNVVVPSDVPPAKAKKFIPPGTRVRISRKSHVIDREREHEGLAPEDRIPIEEEVTGLEGTVLSVPYESPGKNGEVCVPIEVGEGAVMGVPEDRLDPVKAAGPEGSRAFMGSSRRYAAGWERAFGKKKGKRSRK